LTHKAREIGHHAEMILAGRRINDNMGKYIAETTIEKMAEAGISHIDSNTSIFGITFKENCPDLRNTKVPEIINYLKNYKCKISITDPFADPDEAKDFFGIELLKKEQISKSDVVIVAVAHDEYKKMSKKEWLTIINKNGIFIDIKSIYDKDYFSNTNITHWRL